MKRRFARRSSVLRDNNPDPAAIPDRQLTFTPLFRPSDAAIHSLYSDKHCLCQHVGIEAKDPANFPACAGMCPADSRLSVDEHVAGTGGGEDVWVRGYPWNRVGLEHRECRHSHAESDYGKTPM